MLWLCLSLPQLPLEALCTGAMSKPIVVAACEGNARWIVCCNEAAEHLHLKAAMSYTAALSLCPEVTMLERRIQAEQSAIERLAGWAYQFSSTVVLGKLSTALQEAQRAALWIEIGASLKLFGGFRALIETLERELQELRYTYRLGVGPTLEGAALLARAGIRMATTTPQALYARIRDLPIHRLALSTQVCQQLSTAGIRTIGLLLELPRESIAKRFGPQMSNYLGRIMGEAPDPRPSFAQPPQYAAQFAFDFELKSTEALLFPLRRMLHEFAGFLRGRDVCVQEFILALEHRDAAATRVRIGLSIPDRSADKFLSLVHEQLGRAELPAPTIGLSLSADRFSAATAQQSDLFSTASQQREELAHTVDRISARLGEDSVYGLKLHADHRPERSWNTTRTAEKSPTLDSPERPLWLLPEPKPLQISAMPRMASGPERIESGWWDTGDVQRDYYIVRTNNGADLWIYRDLNRDGEWYLHGFWA